VEYKKMELQITLRKVEETETSIKFVNYALRYIPGETLEDLMKRLDKAPLYMKAYPCDQIIIRRIAEEKP
jgi:hypothetical protein